MIFFEVMSGMPSVTDFGVACVPSRTSKTEEAIWIFHQFGIFLCVVLVGINYIVFKQLRKSVIIDSLSPFELEAELS